MENIKKHEWVKMLGAFVVGALLMLAVTGAGGALWQGKLTTTPPFSVEESVVTVGCGTTDCDLATQLGAVSSTLSGGISYIQNSGLSNLSDQIDTVSSSLALGIAVSQISLADQIDMVSRGLVTLIRDTCGE